MSFSLSAFVDRLSMTAGPIALLAALPVAAIAMLAQVL